MDITIKQNDAFRFLAKATGLLENDLSKVICKRMIDERVMYGDNLVCGMSVKQVFELSGYNDDQIMDVLFPYLKHRIETLSVIDNIFFIGLNCQNDCDNSECKI